jgi:DNA-binding HxlR family transcriptional regulator
MAALKPEYGCALQLCNDLIGGKWKLRILWHIVHGDDRFSLLARGIPDITQKMLTGQLRELVDSGILIRTVVETSPLRVEYAVAPDYAQLISLVRQLSDFSVDYARKNQILVPETAQAGS